MRRQLNEQIKSTMASSLRMTSIGPANHESTIPNVSNLNYHAHCNIRWAIYSAAIQFTVIKRMQRSAKRGNANSPQGGSNTTTKNKESPNNTPGDRIMGGSRTARTCLSSFACSAGVRDPSATLRKATPPPRTPRPSASTRRRPAATAAARRG